MPPSSVHRLGLGPTSDDSRGAEPSVLHVLTAAETFPFSCLAPTLPDPFGERTLVVGAEWADRDGTSPRRLRWLQRSDRTAARVAAAALGRLLPTATAVARAAASRPRVVHAHSALAALDVLSCRGLRATPLVVTLTGTDLGRGLQSPPWARHLAAVFEHARAVLVEGFASARIARELGARSARLQVVPQAVDARALERFERVGAVLDQAPRIVICGPAVEREEAAVAIEAVASLRRGGREMELQVVTTRRGRRLLASIADSAGLDGGRVVTAPSDPDDAVRAIVEADVFVALSRGATDGDRECGLPPALRLALAAGCPTVVSRHADWLAALEPHQAASFVEGRGPRAVADAMERLLDSSTESARLSRAARAYATGHLTPSRRAAALRSVYRSALAQRTPALETA